MSKAMLNIFVRTFKSRMKAGETFEEIFASYPKLTYEQKQMIIYMAKMNTVMPAVKLVFSLANMESNPMAFL